MEEFLFLTRVLVVAVYALAFAFLSAFGIHRFWLSRTFNRLKSISPKPKAKFTILPAVTVQLPVYNEKYVVKRLIEHACAIDYPKELLEIQVLDDSTDETVRISRAAVDHYSALGFNITHLHRRHREGFKAGALEEGLKRASGTLIAIFDADFLPPKDILRKTVDFFTDPEIGIVQARWGHVNRNYSLLTRAQSVLLDGHFVVEQTTRYLSGLFFNFNGTAGVIRRECIESAGGWQHDTLTEDLDLSYRAQLEGWKLVYLKDVMVEAELPVDMNAFKSQQHRWTKGAIQTARKLLGRILRSPDLPLRVKVEALFHLLGASTYLVLMVLIALIPPTTFIWKSIGWEAAILLNVFALTSGLMSLISFYVVTLKEVHGAEWVRHAYTIPIAIALGVGIAVNNSKAVIEALLGKESGFERTPKFNVKENSDTWRATKSYVSPKGVTSLVEILIGTVLLTQTVLSLYSGSFEWIPFMALLQFGFFYTGFLSIYHGVRT